MRRFGKTERILRDEAERKTILRKVRAAVGKRKQGGSLILMSEAETQGPVYSKGGNVKRKLCSKCNIWKPVAEFNRHRKYKDGLYYQCRACQKEALSKSRERCSVWVVCAVCGKIFLTHRKYEGEYQKACSHKCSFKKVAPKLWGGHTPVSNAKAATSRLRHPATGLFETNNRAKGYSLISPDGHVFRGHNIAQFVRDNKKLFDSRDSYGCEKGTCLAAHQLTRLRPWLNHTISTWKGWRWDDNTGAYPFPLEERKQLNVTVGAM